ncbi:MAG: ATP-binding protein [Candidatus Neomarinimicrobiota bacterium]
MKLKYQYICFISLLHVIFLILSIQLLPEHKWLFLLAETLILLAVISSVKFYRVLIQPVELIAAGIQTIKDQDFNTQLLKTGQTEMDQLVAVYNRMIEQLRNERVQQQEMHYFLDRLIKAAPVGVIILDFDDKTTMVNQAAAKMIGRLPDDLVGLLLRDLPGDLGRELVTLVPGVAQTVILDGTHAYKCQKSHFRDRGFNHNFILIEELGAEIYKTEKHAYGKIIRLMSHEINNSVGAVNSLLNSFLNYGEYLSVTDRKDFEDAIRVASTRNDHLSQFITNYADVVRLPAPVRHYHDLHQLLRSVDILLQSLYRPRNIDCKWQLASGTFDVDIDIQQFEQVLVNVIKNAVEAIGENGTIVVITTLAPAKTLIVRDSGGGIGADVRRQLFTPFFSTKKDGQGIGLTLVREILQNHGYQFALESPESGRTDFTIRFD